MRIIPCILAALLPACMLMTAPAGAAESTAVRTYLAGKAVVVKPPEGTCAYDHKHLFDAQMLASIGRGTRMGNTVLLAFADCNDLALLRQGKISVNGYYGRITAPFSLRGLNHDTRAQLVKTVSDFAKRSESTGKAVMQNLQFLRAQNIAAETPKTLGIIKEDSDYLMVATLQTQPFPGFAPQPVLGVTITTLLDVPVVITLYHVGDSEEELNKLSEYAQTYVRTLLGLNTPSFFASRKPLDWLLIAIAAMLAAGGLYMLWARQRGVRK